MSIYGDIESIKMLDEIKNIEKQKLSEGRNSLEVENRNNTEEKSQKHDNLEKSDLIQEGTSLLSAFLFLKCMSVFTLSIYIHTYFVQVYALHMHIIV